MRYLSPGNHFALENEVMDAVNKKLKADGVPIEISLIRIPWDAWDQKSNLMLSTGEEFELLHVMQDLKPVGVLYGKHAIIPLNDLLKKYPKLYEHFPKSMWDEVTVDGKILAVPAHTTNKDGKSDGAFYFRKDLLDKLGLPVPKTVDEVIDTAKKLQDAIFKEQGKMSYVYNPMTRPFSWLHRTYAKYPFFVDNTNSELIEVDQDGSVHSWFESDEFKKDAQIYRRMNQMGLINPDLLTLDKDYISREASYGRFAMGFESFDYSSNLVAMSKNYPQAVLGDGVLNPEKGLFGYFYNLNANAIPVTSKHPEAGLMFLNWFYSSKENHDLFMYGIEGKTYTASGSDRFTPMKGQDGKDLYQFDNWMIPDINYRRIETTVPDKVFHIFKDPIKEPVTMSPVVGFRFDTTPVAEEYTNLSNLYKQLILPIKYGFVDYDKAFPDALKKLKAAGLDKYVAEYQKQFSQFLEDKKKNS
ncbi:extracellular solute-binding protein [Gordoniibacillus kamchatkensis]|nr:extracellular solute-binding protein [Paenibacillus sp. VKM B-2647]